MSKRPPRARLASRTLAILVVLLIGGTARSASAAWSHSPWINNPVCTATGDQAVPRAIPDGAGGAIIAWSDQRGGNNDIYAQRIDADGDPMWAANGVAVCTAAFDQINVHVVSDGAGGAILAWQDGRNGNDDIFVQRLDPDGIPQWTGNGVALCTAGGDQIDPYLVSDGAGGAIAGWRDNRFDANGDIFARRVDASGTPQWTADGVALCTAGNAQDVPQVVTDGAGGAILVWNDLRAGTNWDVYAQRVNASGVPQWTANGAVVSVAANSQLFPVATADGFGGVVVAWKDQRAGYDDAFAQRLSPAGVILWPGDRQIDYAGSDGAHPTGMLADGTGGAFIAFHYNPGNWEIGITRIAGAGSILAGPATVSAHPADQRYPYLVSDGSGGVVMAYWAYPTDWGSMRLTSSLVQQWGSVGPSWTVALGDQVNGFLVSDGAGGGILVWQDPRDAAATGYDIYAQRIDHYGVYPDAAPSIVSVRDVPNDQGGKLKLSWDASYLDADPDYAIDEYRVWRSVPEAAATQALRSGGHLLAEGRSPAEIGGRVFDTTIESGEIVYWEYVGSQFASGDAGYSYVVPTTSDSIEASNPPTSVRVQAMHATSAAFWTSTTASGYSVDNLAPAMPVPFTGVYESGATHLHWGVNVEADLSHYNVYRGASAGFVPGPGNRIASPPDTGYADPGDAGGWYKLSAVDIHGNESLFAILAPTGTVDIGPGAGVTELSLARPSPNPAGREAVFGFALPRGGPVALEVFDPSGRRVRALHDGALEAGAHTLRFDLRDDGGRMLGSGLYFVRLSAEGRALTSPFVVVR